MGILSILVFLPLLLLLPVLALPSRQGGWPFRLAVGAAVLQLSLMLLYVLPLYVNQIPYIQPRGLSFLLYESTPWLQLSLGNSGHLVITYELGLDGVNILFALLTPLILLIATFASRHVSHRPRTYFSLLLLLNTTMMGCFLAQDFFLFYLFFEFMLLPLFFLIADWGGRRSRFAALKFFLYTLLGSVYMLVVMVGLFNSYIDPVQTAYLMEGVSSPQEASRMAGRVLALLREGALAPQDIVHSFSFSALTNPANRLEGSVFTESLNARTWAFLGLFFAFAVKLPVVPVHTWLPDAHVEASTPISVLLAGILLKVGGYGLVRVAYPIFPEAALGLSDWIGALAVVSILYPALIALAQTDLKRMIAYSSVSHMGFVLLGIVSFQAEGVNGAVYQMFNHGLITASLFLLAGILQQRVGDRQIGHFQGLWHTMPRYTFFVAVAFFAGLGLPGFGAFVSELLVIAGAFRASYSAPGLPVLYSVLAVVGVVLAAGYFLRSFRRMFFGEYRVMGGDDWKAKLTDLSRGEMALLIPLALLTLLTGVLPHWFLNLIDDTIAQWVNYVGG